MNENARLSKPKPFVAANPAQGSVMATCDVVPMGNGSFHVVPRRLQNKISIKEAARLAHYSRDTIYRLFHSGFVTGERQSPRKILIDAESLQAHLAAVREPDFWTRERRERYWGA